MEVGRGLCGRGMVTFGVQMDGLVAFFVAAPAGMYGQCWWFPSTWASPTPCTRSTAFPCPGFESYCTFFLQDLFSFFIHRICFPFFFEFARSANMYVFILRINMYVFIHTSYKHVLFRTHLYMYARILLVSGYTS
jgi:hypothetical protein